MATSSRFLTKMGSSLVENLEAIAVDMMASFIALEGVMVSAYY